MLLANSWDELGIRLFVGFVYLAFSLLCLFSAPIPKTILRRPSNLRIAAVDVGCLLVVVALLTILLRAFYPPRDRDFVAVVVTSSGLFLIWWAIITSRLAGNGMPVRWRVIFEVGVLPALFLGPPLLAATILNCYLAPLSHHGAPWSIQMIRPIDWVLLGGCSFGIIASVALVVYLSSRSHLTAKKRILWDD